MTTPLLTTKLYVPPARPLQSVVSRPRLIEQLNEGLHSGRKLTLISAPAGFGKTTLVSEWIHGRGARTGAVTAPLPAPLPAPLRVAWLSLDEGENDLARFLTYFIAALQTIETRQERAGTIGTEALRALHAAQPQQPPTEAILTALINEIASSLTIIT